MLQKTQKIPFTNTAPKRPVLVVLHQEMSTPGRIGHYLTSQGYPLDARRPVLGEELPETLADHSGVVVFGEVFGSGSIENEKSANSPLNIGPSANTIPPCPNATRSKPMAT